MGNKALRAALLAFFLISLAGAAAAKDPLSVPVKRLLVAPDEGSGLIYEIPIEVQLLDVSADGNWHKVKISYTLGPISRTYVGWAKIPIGKVLAARTEKVAKAPPPQEVSEP